VAPGAASATATESARQSVQETDGFVSDGEHKPAIASANLVFVSGTVVASTES
jgi:hypothetical protein